MLQWEKNVFYRSPNLHLEAQPRPKTSKWLFPSDFLTKPLRAPLLSPSCATRPVLFLLLDFITRVICGEEYRSLSSTSYSPLHSPVAPSLLGPIPSSAPYTRRRLSLEKLILSHPIVYSVNAKSDLFLFCVLSPLSPLNIRDQFQ